MPTASPTARPLVAARVRARPASPGTPSPTAGSSRRSAAGAARSSTVRRHRGRRVLPLADAGRCRSRSARWAGPRSGMAMDVVDADGSRSRRGRRAGLPQAVARDDPRHLERPRALPRHLLVAMAGRLGARRLGLGRRGRLLVPARPLRRHAQHRRQADRAGRGRVGRGRPRGGRRGGGGRRAARGEGRGRPGSSACSRPAPSRRRARRRGPAAVAGELGKAFGPTGSCSSRRCRRRARRRSCGARCARRRSARIPATSRRSRIRKAWTTLRAPSGAGKPPPRSNSWEVIPSSPRERRRPELAAVAVCMGMLRNVDSLK